MIKHAAKFALFVATMAALPGAAHAGTATATGTATLTVVSQCTVTGAAIDLGSYTTSQTWGDVATANGYIDQNALFQAGTRGLEYLNYGSVTCDTGVPYTLSILGSNDYIQITHNGKKGQFVPAIKKLGGVAVADNDPSIPSVGANVSDFTLAGVGTGAAQTLQGSAVLYSTLNTTTALLTDQLGVSGVATDSLTYTLNF